MFAKSVVMLGSAEENSALSCALSELAKVEDKLQQLHQQQALSDFFIHTGLLADYVRLLGAVQVKKNNTFFASASYLTIPIYIFLAKPYLFLGNLIGVLQG